VALCAFRAERRFDVQLDAAALAVHRTMLEVAVQGAFVNVVLGRWHGPSSMFSSITRGHQRSLLITEQGS
jgi:hypothetical protein